MKNTILTTLLFLAALIAIAGFPRCIKTVGYLKKDAICVARNDSNSITLTWDKPTTNADGTPLTDLSGYKIYYGINDEPRKASIKVYAATSYYIKNLKPGTYHFSVTAFDSFGNESSPSNVACTK